MEKGGYSVKIFVFTVDLICLQTLNLLRPIASNTPRPVHQHTINPNMRVSPASVAFVASLSLISPFTSGFVFQQQVTSSSRVTSTTQPNGLLQLHQPHSLNSKHTLLQSTTTAAADDTTTPSSSSTTTKKKKKKLGLITFDLDDTLYPIAPVLDEANAAFSTAMGNFGYVDIQPSDIVEAGKMIRAQVSGEDGGDAGGIDPLKPTTVNHKEIRMAAIRKEMEEFILKTKLKQTALDWATDVDDLTAPVRKSAEK